jgi:hypothetical protein
MLKHCGGTTFICSYASIRVVTLSDFGTISVCLLVDLNIVLPLKRTSASDKRDIYTRSGNCGLTIVLRIV